MGDHQDRIVLLAVLLFALIIGQPTAARRTEGRPRHHKRYQLGDQAYVPRVRCGYGPAFSRYHEFNETLDDPNEDDGEDSAIRVAGGYDAQPGDFPSFVSIKIIGDGIFSCSGVLIDDDVVLTAGHCFEAKPIHQVLVSPSVVPVGRWETDSAPTYHVGRVCLSSSYDNPRSTYDYAYVKLAQRIPMTRQVNTACLPMNDVDQSTPARALGQGAILMDKGKITQPGKVQILPVRRVECPAGGRHLSISCFRDYDPRFKGDTCLGDSGGPVYVMDSGLQTVAALTISGDAICRPGRSGTSYSSDLTNFRNKFHVLVGIKECFDTGKGMVFNSRNNFQSNATLEDSGDEC